MTINEQIENKTAVIAILGLGYVGLPLAIAFAEAGFKVIGIDEQSSKIEAINARESYITDVNNESLAAVLSGGMLSATTDESTLKEADAVCICVQTPISRTKHPVSGF